MRRPTQRGISLLELLLVVAIILVLSGIATVNLMSARRAARESAASATVRSVTTAQLAYAYTYGGFADALRKLGPPAEGGLPWRDAADLLDASVGCPAQPCNRQGYAFAITGASGVPVHAYFVTAAPTSAADRRSFCSSERATILSVDDSDPMMCVAEMMHRTGKCADESDSRCRR
jgi:prepilin-type N-terminal cleavage/methylation domain-containing protein